MVRGFIQSAFFVAMWGIWSPAGLKADDSPAAATPKSQPIAPTSQARTQLSENAALEKAKPAVGALKKQLVGRLQEAIGKDGAVKAIEVCRTEAGKITAGVSNQTIQVGRTATKLRNPANAPQEWMKPLLEYFERKGGMGNAEPFKIVKLSGDQYGYVEPLYIQPLCMTCHGTKIPADVQAEINKLYPADRAVGYSVGDFRGVAWSIVK